MKINDLSKQMYLNRLNQVSKAQSSQKIETKSQMTPDKIELSTHSKELNKYIELAKISDSEASDKVAQIKAQLEQGTYSLSSQQIAQAMLRQMK